LEILLFISIPDEPPPYKGNNIVQFETIELRGIHLKIRISSMPHMKFLIFAGKNSCFD
jgi:hypothetical protein